MSRYCALDNGYVHVVNKKGFFEVMSSRKLKVSVLALGALFLVVGGFSLLITAIYPIGNPVENVPIIRADKVAFKERPSDPGGMNIANRDSALYETFRSTSSDRGIENLLEQSGQPMDKLEAFAQQVEAKLKEQEIQKSLRLNALEEEQGHILQKIEPASGGGASVASKSKTKAFYRAGQSPETIDFIRSVLKEKEAVQVGEDSTVTMGGVDVLAQAVEPYIEEASINDAEKFAAIAPAAGAAVSAGTYTSGLYFVQLASIGDRSRAPSEWIKMQKSHIGALLSDANYRVARADLGAEGVFYRIQAGPFRKQDAHSLCDAIKQQKPGGCLVTQ